MIQTDYTYISTRTHLKRYAPKIIGKRVIGIDIETKPDGTEKGDARDPLRGFIRLIQVNNGEENFLFDMDYLSKEDIGFLVGIINDGSVLKIAHNAKFEIKWFMHHLGAEPRAFFDTMLASQLIAAGMPDENFAQVRHDLAEVAFVFAGITMDKSEQKSDWSQPELSESQLRYAAHDIEVLIPIWRNQVERLKADDLVRVATIEFDAIKPIARMELNGFYLDAERWRELLVKKKADLARVEAEMLDIFQPGVDWTMPNPEKRGKRPVKPKKPVNPRRAKANKDRHVDAGEMVDYSVALEHYEKVALPRWQEAFERWEALPDEVTAVLNPASPDQMKRVLKNVLGIEFESTKEQFLLEYEHLPEIKKLLEFRGAEKSVTSYGDNILELLYEDSRLRSDFRQIGAPTGRMASKNPNIQQVPGDEAHRRCFRAPAGRKLIIADYSQIELRILAEFARDANFVGDFNSGLDLHTKGASRFMSIPYEEVKKEQRGYAKRINFGVVYGIMKRRLAAQLGITEDEAERLMRAYFRTYPGNEQYLERARRQAMERLFARTSSGRIQRFHHDGTRKGTVAAIGRNGMNMPIQGTAADMFKRALFLLDEALVGTSGKIVNVVHDEIIVEVDEGEAEAVARLVEEAMAQAGVEYISTVEVKADALIADEWIKD